MSEQRDDVHVALGWIAAALVIGAMLFFSSRREKPPIAGSDWTPPTAAEQRATAERLQKQWRREAEERAARRRGSWSGGGLSQDQKALAATILNVNGLLCAEVVEVRRLALDQQFEVTCIRYRGGSARASYVINTETGRAFEQ